MLAAIAAILALASLAAGSVLLTGASSGFPRERLIAAPVVAALTAGFASFRLVSEWRRPFPDPNLTPADRDGRAQTAWACFFVALLGCLVLSNGYQAVGDLVRASHEPGRLAFTVDAGGGPRDRDVHLKAAVCTWMDYFGPTAPEPWPRCEKLNPNVDPNPPSGKFGDARTFLGWQLGVIDSMLLVPAYLVLFTLVVRLARLAVEDAEQEDPPIRSSYFNVGKLALGLAAAAAAADWIENGLSAAAVGDLWLMRIAGQELCGTALWCSGPAVTVLSTATALKIIGLLGATLYGIVVLTFWLRGPAGAAIGIRGRQVAYLLSRLRMHILVLVIFGAALFANDQVQDLLRRWIDERSVAVWSLGLCVVFALAMGLTAWWVLADRERIDLSAHVWPTIAAATASYTGIWLAFALITASNALWWAPLLVPLIAVAVLGLRGRFDSDEAVRLSLVITCLALGVVVFGGWMSGRRDGADWGPAAPILIVLVVALLSRLNRSPKPSEPPTLDWMNPGNARPWFITVIPWTIGALTLALLGIAALSATFEVIIARIAQDEQPDGGLLWPTGLACVGLAAAVALPFGSRWPQAVNFVAGFGTGGSILRPLCALSIAAFIWLLLAGRMVDLDTRWVPARQGVGVLAGFLILVIVMASSIVVILETVLATPPGVFRFLRLRRVPILSLMGIWFVVAAALPPADLTNKVRLGAAPKDRKPMGMDQAFTIQSAFTRWAENQCLLLPRAPTEDLPVAPLILISTEGGGIRSAAWTTYVLDRVFDYRERAPPGCGGDLGTIGAAEGAAPQMRPANWIFAASGVSGGAVGVATYVARQAVYDRDSRAGALMPDPETGPPTPNSEKPDRSGWVRTSLGVDSISPLIAWAGLIELPRALFRFPLEPQPDRAGFLEDTWQRFWWQEPKPATEPLNYFDLERNFRTPLLIVNGSSVESGCRFNASALLGTGRESSDPVLRCKDPLGELQHGVLGATGDLPHYLCAGQDVPLATVTMMGARFPYIAPAGALERCATPAGEVPVRTYLVDGGYHEGSGAATILDVWLALQPFVDRYNADRNRPANIVPFLIQIDNAYREAAAAERLVPSPELLVPVATVMNSAMSANHERARQAAELEFNREFRVNATQCWPAKGARDPNEPNDPSRIMTGRYARFALAPHPGPTAPLGWTLSNVSFDELVRQFRSNVGSRPAAEVATWFTGHFGNCSTLADLESVPLLIDEGGQVDAGSGPPTGGDEVSE